MYFSVDDLHMERTCQDDRDAFCSLLSDPVVTHMNGRTAEVDALFTRYLKNIYSFSVYNGDVFMGLCSLFPTSLSSALSSVRALELVYSVVPEYWNCGVASYSADRICRMGFSEIGLDCILAGCFSDNPASARVLQKSGFKRIFDRAGNGLYFGRTETVYLKTGLR